MALALAVLLGLSPAARAATEVPQPPPGQAAPTALALLDYNRGLCDGIGRDALGYWRSLEDSPEAEQTAVRDFVVDERLSDLAAGRAATDIARSLLPRVRSETEAETAAALERLLELVARLCDVAAVPTAPRDGFEALLGDVVDRIEREEEELGRLLVVPEDTRAAALELYLTPIQLAGFEAESEYLDYLESLREKPPEKSLDEYLREWHERYSLAVQPTKQALGQYLQARASGDSRAMVRACREILGAVNPLLRDGEIFELPVPQLPASKGIAMQRYLPLEKAYREIRELAVDCNAGRQREVIEHFEEMQKQLQIAAAHLARFSLAP